MPKTMVLVPCYKRPEYTQLCIQALEKAQDYHDVEFVLVDDGSNDETGSILHGANLPFQMIERKESAGLRATIMEFFELSKGAEYIAKIDNDCLVPANWLTKLLFFLEAGHADMVSPNVFPSNAAFKLGKETDIKDFRSASFVGGLWCMRRSLLDDISFEKLKTCGITGAFPLLQRIIVEKDPKIGWVTSVTVEDVGHYSGKHPQHIKSEAHLEYSQEVGRSVSWI